MAASLARPKARTLIIVLVVSFAAVFGSLTALATLSTTSSGPRSYAVVFYESGLPYGANFSVEFNGVTNSTIVQSSLSARVNFVAPNGTYSFSVHQVQNYTAEPMSGKLNVSGMARFATIDFQGSEGPIGAAFVVGNPVLSSCPTNDTYAAEGCRAGDWYYKITIEASSVMFGDVLFVVRTATGSNYTIGDGSGGFSILDIAGTVAAQTSAIAMGEQLAMTTSWSIYTGSYGDSSYLTSIYSIVVDVGRTDPAGTGLTFVVYGYGPYSGMTTPLSLP